MILPRVERFRVLKLLRTEEIDEHRGGERVHKLATKEERAVRNRWRRKSRYYRRRNITQKIASVTPSSLVNYRELPIIIRSVKVFTIVVGRAGLGTMMQSLDGPTLSVNPPRCNLQFRNLRFLRGNCETVASILPIDSSPRASLSFSSISNFQARIEIKIWVFRLLILSSRAVNFSTSFILSYSQLKMTVSMLYHGTDW